MGSARDIQPSTRLTRMGNVPLLVFGFPPDPGIISPANRTCSAVTPEINTASNPHSLNSIPSLHYSPQLNSTSSTSTFAHSTISTMAPTNLEREDHSRDAAFNKAMHKNSSKAEGGFSAMLKKDTAAHQASVDEYFKHWDQKAAKDETDADREVRWISWSACCSIC
jgi:hypothetical protein